jgi:uncharacterized protein YbbK (DUF523 family)
MIVVSACLLGFNCRYDGRSRPEKTLLLPAVDTVLIPICPEQMGGLPTPRTPSEIKNGDGLDVLEGRARVVSTTGEDVTDNFLRGAEEVLRFMKQMGVLTAIMTEESPSCGVFHIKRGGTILQGSGVTSALLAKNGINIISSDRIREELKTIAGRAT